MTILWVHAGLTLYLVGLIWFVQVVHYPLLARLSPDGFAAHAMFHVKRTTLVVAPAMLGEAAIASWLAVSPPRPDLGPWTLAGFALLLVIWLSTALLQVPCHRRFELEGHDPATAARLGRTNWIRTVAWTARGVLALVMCAVAARC